MMPVKEKQKFTKKQSLLSFIIFFIFAAGLGIFQYGKEHYLELKEQALEYEEADLSNEETEKSVQEEEEYRSWFVSMKKRLDENRTKHQEWLEGRVTLYGQKQIYTFFNELSNEYDSLHQEALDRYVSAPESVGVDHVLLTSELAGLHESTDELLNAYIDRDVTKQDQIVTRQKLNMDGLEAYLTLIERNLED